MVLYTIWEIALRELPGAPDFAGPGTPDIDAWQRSEYDTAADVLGEGRDHNQYGFSVWLAGAGLKHGVAFGTTDEIGMKAAENPVHWHDFHATILNLLGIDHERLTYYHNGIRRRLTDVSGHVVREILA